MNASWIVRTGRLILRPVGFADLADLVRLKTDPRVFAVMLGGVRSPARVAEELAEDIAFWGRHGMGIWTIHATPPPDAAEGTAGAFLGIVGLHLRHDGRGMALRFALAPEAQGHGYASEAAAAALRFGHERAGQARIVGVARESNIHSRMVLGGIGMVECERYERDGQGMLVYESVRPGKA